VSSFLRQHIGFPPFPRIIWATRWSTSPAWSPRDRAAGPPGPGPASGLARPARQALAAAGHVTLEQRTQVTEADLARVHHIRPKAISPLRDALAAAGLSFATEN